MRVQGWEHMLDGHIMAAAEKTFKYGHCDCAVFVSDWVMLCTGIDPIKEGRGRYKDMRNGALLIKHFRGSYEGIMDYYFKRHKAATYSKRGDVVLKKFNGVPAFGIVGGNGKAFFKNENGLLDFSLKDCLIGWEVK